MQTPKPHQPLCRRSISARNFSYSPFSDRDPSVFADEQEKSPRHERTLSKLESVLSYSISIIGDWKVSKWQMNSKATTYQQNSPKIVPSSTHIHRRKCQKWNAVRPCVSFVTVSPSTHVLSDNVIIQVWNVGLRVRPTLHQTDRLLCWEEGMRELLK